MISFLRSKHQYKSNREKGQAFVTIAIMFIALLAFVGLVIDVGRVFIFRGGLRNAVDAASLAALAALFNAKVPMNRLRGTFERIQEKFPDAAKYLKEYPEDFPLPLRDPPISCTFAKFHDVVVVDPSVDELEIADARITVATDADGDIRAMQKGLKGSFTVDEIKKIIKDSVINGSELRNKLKESVGK